MRINSIKYVLLLVMLSYEVRGQRGLFWLNGMELGGTPRNSSYHQNKDILDIGLGSHLQSGVHFSVGTSLYYRFSRSFGIEVGIMNNHINVPLRDKIFQTNHKISKDPDDNKEGNFDPCINYTNKYFAAHFFSRDFGGIEIYFGGGISINTASSSSINLSQSYSDHSSNETLFLKGSFIQNFYSPFIETGVFFHSPYKKTKCFFGLKYSFAPLFFDTNYYNIQNSNILYQDHMAVDGSTLNISCKFGIDLAKPSKLSMYRQSKKKAVVSSIKSKRKAEQALKSKIKSTKKIKKKMPDTKGF